MLQFISNYNTSPVLVFSFNTSHVVVYHVTDYQNTPVGVLFQYISCCSLSCGSQKCILSILVSIHLMLQFIFVGSFRSTANSLFQYISCCSLSSANICKAFHSGVSIHLMLQFIALERVGFNSYKAVSIHLMLQFIVQVGQFLQTASGVSIHLMLQFIAIGMIGNENASLFQYISCCSLSHFGPPKRIH